DLPTDPGSLPARLPDDVLATQHRLSGRSGSRLAPLDRAELRLEVAFELVVAHHAAGVHVGETRFDLADELLSLFFRRHDVLGDPISDEPAKNDEVVL